MLPISRKGNANEREFYFFWLFTEGEIWIWFSVGICITQFQVIVIRVCFQQQLFVGTHETIGSFFHENILKIKDIFHKCEKLRFLPRGVIFKVWSEYKRAYFFCKILAKYLHGKTFHFFTWFVLKIYPLYLLFMEIFLGQHFIGHLVYLRQWLKTKLCLT